MPVKPCWLNEEVKKIEKKEMKKQVGIGKQKTPQLAVANK